MTVTIEVKPETAARWQKIAAREGRALGAVATEAAETGTDAMEKVREESRPALAPAERRAAMETARGSMKDLSGSADGFLRERSEEAAEIIETDKSEIARKLALMDEFVEAAREYSQGAVLSDDAVSREAIYEGRGA